MWVCIRVTVSLCYTLSLHRQLAGYLTPVAPGHAVLCPGVHEQEVTTNCSSFSASSTLIPPAAEAPHCHHSVGV